MADEFRYFRSVHGHVVPRYGTPALIGCRPTGAGFVWDEDVYAIPTAEITRYVREYREALATNALVEVGEAEMQQLRAESEAKAKAAATAVDALPDGEAPKVSRARQRS